LIYNCLLVFRDSKLVVYVGSPSPAIGMILAAHLKYPIATKV
jgi:hypothetical protein